MGREESTSVSTYHLLFCPFYDNGFCFSKHSECDANIKIWALSTVVIVFQSEMSPLQYVPFAVEFLKKASEPLINTIVLLLYNYQYTCATYFEFGSGSMDM